jgi:hypothetical protein
MACGQDEQSDWRAEMVVSIIRKHLERARKAIDREVPKHLGPDYPHTEDLWLQYLANVIGIGCFECCARRGHLSEIVIIAEQAWLVRQAVKGTAKPGTKKPH